MESLLNKPLNKLFPWFRRYRIQKYLVNLKLFAAPWRTMTFIIIDRASPLPWAKAVTAIIFLNGTPLLKIILRAPVPSIWTPAII